MVSRSKEHGAERRPVLVTGATGYVGGRLLRGLEERGLLVRCLARKPANLASRVAEGTEVVRGDAVSGEGLGEALSGVETAYYLIHSMGAANGRPSTSGPQRVRRESGASSTSAGSRTRVRSFRRTCAADSKSEGYCATPACR
jgi:uncharacterized protein YbjT (DUF2867 family)